MIGENVTPDPIDHLIELRGVYDGWIIAVHKDGTLHNRWADEDGNAIPGYERQWRATEEAIAKYRLRTGSESDG